MYPRPIAFSDLRKSPAFRLAAKEALAGNPDKPEVKPEHVLRSVLRPSSIAYRMLAQLIGGDKCQKIAEDLPSLPDKPVDTSTLQGIKVSKDTESLLETACAISLRHHTMVRTSGSDTGIHEALAAFLIGTPEGKQFCADNDIEQDDLANKLNKLLAQEGMGTYLELTSLL